MQKYMIKQAYKDAKVSGNKFIIKTNIPYGLGINGVDFYQFVMNAFPEDKPKKQITSIDFHDYGLDIIEKNKMGLSFITSLDYSSIVSVVCITKE